MPDWIGSVGGIIAAIIGLGAITQFLRGSRDKGTITTLEQNNAALTERVALLEASEKLLKAEAAAERMVHTAAMEALNVRMKALENDNADLRSQRPSAEAIEAVYTLEQVIHSDTQKIARGVDALMLMMEKGST